MNEARMTKARFNIVRPHNIYGPFMGYDHVVPEFINRIFLCEDPFVIRGGTQTRSFCYIDDFGIGREETEVVRVAELLFEIAGVKRAVKLEPAWPGSVARRRPDISQARACLGFEPKVELREGLEKTSQWYAEKELS